MVSQRYKLAMKELVNKIKAFTYFQHINIILKFDIKKQKSPVDVLGLLDRLDTENFLWAAEGIGYLFTEKIVNQEFPGSHLFLVNDYEHNFLGILHSGMGMSLANNFLMKVDMAKDWPFLTKGIKQYLSLLNKVSLPGYEKIPVESLGFISRLLFPDFLPVINQLFHEVDDELVPYLWHGVGRALCFLPRHLWPGCSSPWRAIEIAESEAPHETAFLNILAGLGWPLTLVNIKHPQIMEQVLRYHGKYLSKNDAFSSGVSSAVLFLRDYLRENSLIMEFYNYKPEDSEPGLHKTWDKLIKIPCEKALEHFYPYLKREHRWSELFKYRPNLPSH
jgi:hypothetical protein